MNGNFKVNVDRKSCKGCGLCVDICPRDVFDLKGKYAVVKEEDSCIGCLRCEYYCPDYAISVKKNVVNDNEEEIYEKKGELACCRR